MVDESAFDRGLYEAAERQSQDDDDSDRSRDVRPGRGTETGTTQPIDDGGSSGGSSSGGGDADRSDDDADTQQDTQPSAPPRAGEQTEPTPTEPRDTGGGDADRSDGAADSQQDMQQDDAPPSRDGGGRRPGDRGDADPRLEPTEEEAQTLEDIEERAGGGVLSPGQEQFLRDLSDRVTGPAAAAVTSIFDPGERNQNVIIDDPLRAIGEEEEAEAVERTVAEASRGAAGSVETIIDFPQLLLGAERGIEFGQGAAATAREQGARPVGEALTTAFRGGATAAVGRARQNPAATAGGLLGDIAIGFGIGRVVGRGGTLVRDRVRTAGGQDITEAVTNPATRQFFDDVDRGRPADPSDRFPGAQDPDLLRRDPAAAVRQQADEFTPDDVTEAFEDAGVPEGSVLKKALDVEPEGPDTGRLQRAGGGLETRAGDYELPGSFFGPEVSPNFFRTTRRTGIRPGLPDFGGRPTAVFARTDVENPRARTRDEFADELVERAGEPTALGRPDPNPGEIEAVVPPGAQFRDIDRSLSRRVGIGSDFFVRSSGRRIPVRLVEPDRPRGDIDIDDITFRGTGTGTLDELSERLRPRVDRPSPVVTPGGTSSSGSDIIDSDSGLFSIGGPSPPISSPGGPSSPSDPFGPSGSGGSPSRSTPPSSPSIAGPPSGSSSGAPTIDFPIPSSGGPGKPIFPRRTPGVTAPEGDLLGDEAIFEFEVPEL